MLIRLYFSVFAFFFSSVLAQNPLVITKYGAVIGASYPTPSGVVVSEFIGVPFAAPPLGNLRFERPKPPTPWTTPLNVSTYALDCVPCNLDWAEGPSSEDCLYLNIWTPSLNNSNLPVAVWIHGGGWGTGTAQMENKRIREIYGQNGIVVVSIAYRVGFFGFLTLNNTALPANLGLWDQNLALKWIQENIGRFGGDSKRVTVWGQSAGGASSGLHSLSPHSQGLFAQSFEQSGSPISDWGRGNPTMLQFSTDTLNKLGCPTSGDIKSCLKGKTLNELHTAVGACVIGDDMSFLALTPLVDGDFFTEQPEQAIKLYPPKPTILGLMQKEGRAFLLEEPWPPSMTPDQYNSMTSDTFLQFITYWVTRSTFNQSRIEAALDIYNFYAQNHSDPNDHYFWIEQYDQLFSDIAFNVPLVREGIARSAVKTSTWAFVLDYYNEDAWPVNFPCQGSTHGTEYPYILGFQSDYNFTQIDDKVASIMQQFAIQFIKTGNPSTASLKWDPFTSSDLQYMSFKPAPEMKKDLHKDAQQFWSTFMRKYDYDYITRRNWDR